MLQVNDSGSGGVCMYCILHVYCMYCQRYNRAATALRGFNFSEEIFVLVLWPEKEHNVSVISNVHHPIQGAIVVGEICNVAFGKKTFPAMVHATGNDMYMSMSIHMTLYVCVCAC